MKQVILILIVLTIVKVSALQLMVYPDIQEYTRTDNSILANMTNYIINNSIDKEVLLVGDVVQNDKNSRNITREWEIINNTLKELTYGNISYSISWGCHDIEGNNYTEQERLRFKLYNNSIGLIVIPFNITESELNQTKEFLQNNSNYSFILLTHRYLTSNNEINESENFNIYERLINNSNIFLIVSGHNNGNNINITDNHTGFITGHAQLDGLVSIININSTDEISIINYDTINNRAVTKLNIYNKSILENTTDIELQKEIELYKEEHKAKSSGGGGGGGSSKKSNLVINTTNITTENITIVKELPELVNWNNSYKVVISEEIELNFWQRILEFLKNLLFYNENKDLIRSDT